MCIRDRTNAVANHGVEAGACAADDNAGVEISANQVAVGGRQAANLVIGCAVFDRNAHELMEGAAEAAGIQANEVAADDIVTALDGKRMGGKFQDGQPIDVIVAGAQPQSRRQLTLSLIHISEPTRPY